MAKTYYEARINSNYGDTVFKSGSIDTIRKSAWNYLRKSNKRVIYIVVWRGSQPGMPYATVEKSGDGMFYKNLEKRTIQWFKPNGNGTLYPYR